MPSTFKPSESKVSQYILLRSDNLNDGTASPDVLNASSINETISEKVIP